MTFRQLLTALQNFASSSPDHEALDEPVVVRLQTDENDDELHAGGLRAVTVCAGCTETFALVLDADQDPDKPDEAFPKLDKDPLNALLAERYRVFVTLKNELLEANVCLACGRQCTPYEGCHCENDE